MGEFDLEIRNIADVNMSIWQISHTVNTLTTVNNKFDILNKLNNRMRDGVKANNIFVIDKSFSFIINYTTYFSKNEVSEEKSIIDVEKICNMGKIISMESNHEITNINILFEFTRKLSKIINNSLKCRLKKQYLCTAYKKLFEQSLDIALKDILNGAKEQICEIYERRISPNYIEMNSIVQKCDDLFNSGLNKIIIKCQEINDDSTNKFKYFFNSCARPIIGIYSENNNRFEILNADQMYKNGEESPSQIKLNKITRNSPVLLAFIVVGTMGAVMGYLAYRNHKVNSIVSDENILDVPSDRKDAIKNILSNDDNNFLDIDEKVLPVDKLILNLALDTYSKLELITDKKRVNLNLIIHKKSDNIELE